MKKIFFVLLPVLILMLSGANEVHHMSKEETYMVLVNGNNLVSAGTKYEGEVFLYKVPSSRPSIYVDGMQVTVDENGIGKFSFTAVPGAFDRDGLAKKRLKATVRLKINNKDTVYEVIHEYMVQKPVVQIEGNTTSLYANCGNELNVQVPSLGYTYNPSFRTVGARVIAGVKKGMVTVIPTGSITTLDISSNGNLVGSRVFKVQKVPVPELTIYQDSLPVDLLNGVNVSALTDCQIKIRPDPFFQENFPKDSRFKITEVRTSLRRLNQIVDTLSFTQSKLDLTPYKSKAQKGDRILVEVKKISRANFLNQIETIEPEEIITIPLY